MAFGVVEGWKGGRGGRRWSDGDAGLGRECGSGSNGGRMGEGKRRRRKGCGI